MEIYGSGKGGGGGSSPIEQDDTLGSRQTVRALLAFSEGPIESVDEVYLNNTPASSYKRVNYEVAYGYETQNILPGFSQVESPHPDTTAIELPEGTRITKTVTSPTVSALRITLGLSALFRIDPDNNVMAMDVSFDIYHRPNASASWTKWKRVTKSGKTRNPYAWNIRVPKQAITGPDDLWQVSIIRVTPDDDSTNRTNSKTSWVLSIEVFESRADVDVSYPNTALMGITVQNANRLGNTIPTLMLRAKGLKLKVPSEATYDAETGTYLFPAWDGVWAAGLYYTANPAWIIYNVLTNTRWGLGIPEDEIDKFAFFDLAVYCDELVSNGKGGLERRYELHNQFMNREDSSTFLMYLLNICNANIITDNFGLISITFDHDEEPSLIIGNNEVEEGVFNYSSSNAEDRFTQVNVTWNNPALLGGTDTETWPKEYPDGSFEKEMLDRYGLQSTDIVLAGCYSQRQAVWKARYIFYTTCKCTQIVNFNTLFFGNAFKIGQIIQILDNDNINATRVIKLQSYAFEDSNTLELNLTNVVTLPAEVFTVIYATGSGFAEYPIVNTAEDTSVLRIEHSSAVATPLPNTDVYIIGDIQPTLWKVSGISVDTESQAHTITAVEHKIGKFAYVEEALVLPDENYFGYPSTSVAPVESISVIKDIYMDSIGSSVNLNIKWLWFQDSSIKVTYLAEHSAWVSGGSIGPEPVPRNTDSVAFQVSYRRNGGNFVLLDTVYGMSATIENALFGEYDIIVNALSPTGLESIDETYHYSYIAGTPSSLLPPENIYVEGTSGTDFLEENARISFTWPSANDSVEAKLLGYIIEVYSADGSSLKNTYRVAPNSTKGGLLIYTYANNLSDFGSASREFLLKVYSQDTEGNISTSADVTFTNPAPNSIGISVEMAADTATVSFPSFSGDSRGFILHMSTIDGFIPSSGNVVYEGSDTKATIYLPASGIYYFKAAEFDAFGKDSLNYSSQVAGTCTGLPASRIQTNTLLKLDSYSLAGTSISVPSGTETEILAYDFTSLQAVGTQVLLRLDVGFGCSLATTKILLYIYDTSNNLITSARIYDRDSQQIEQRLATGGRLFNVTVPTGGIFRLKLKVKQTGGTAFNFNDPYIDIMELIKP